MHTFNSLTPGYQAVASVALPLAVIVFLALLTRGVPRIMFMAQVFYWGMAFIGRPLLLLQTNPHDSFGDNIADPRLEYLGYDYAIEHVLIPIRQSLWLYVAFVVAFVLWQRLSGPAPAPLNEQSSLTMTTFVAMWSVGMAARAAAYLTGSVGKAGELHNANPYLALLTDLCSLAALGVIVYFRDEKWWREVAVIGFFGAVELGWGIAEESKTPFLGAMLALAVRYLSTGLSRAKFTGIAAGAAGVASIFGWMQSMKSSQRASNMTNSAGLTYNLSYPPEVRDYLAIFRRFDLLEASTDVYYMNGQPWKTPSEIVRLGVINLIPQQLGVTKVQSGPDWAQHVRGRSVDMSQIAVSLADGHLNEGYLLDGLWGVGFESLFVIGMIAAVARCLRSRNIVAITIALCFVSMPPLFERGVLGITETLGKGLQQGAFAFGLYALIWLNRQFKARAAPLAATSVSAIPGRT